SFGYLYVYWPVISSATFPSSKKISAWLCWGSCSSRSFRSCSNSSSTACSPPNNLNPMTIIETIILGIVEGITEFLPISSTAHLILASRVLGCAQVEFLKSFEIIIQLGAILSVIVLYGKSLLRQPEVLKRVAVAFVPTAVIGFLLYKIIKNI